MKVAEFDLGKYRYEEKDGKLLVYENRYGLATYEAPTGTALPMRKIFTGKEAKNHD